MLRGLLLPSNLDGSGFYRCLLPGGVLEERGVGSFPVAPHGRSQDGRHVRLTYEARTRSGGRVPLDRVLLDLDFDVLWMQQREEPGWAVLIRALQAQGKRVLVDSDDLWAGLPSWNPGSRKAPEAVAAMFALVAQADGLSVATPALAEAYRPFNRNIRVIRNRLDWRMWDDVVPAYELERRRVRVGWMGELRWRAGDLDVLKPWLGPWLARHPEVEFVAAGDPRVHDYLGVPVGQRVSTGPVEFHNLDLADITATFDIGLVPLKVDEQKARMLNECKSHLKGMEYAACGIPCIATPTESYRYWVNKSHGVSGFLASTPDEWVDWLDEMLVDDNWRDLGAAARRKAERHTLQADSGEWEAWIAGSDATARQRLRRDRPSVAA